MTFFQGENMTNPFGTKMTYSPIPKVILWEIIGREKVGKTELVARLLKPGIGLVIDSDGKFSNSVPKESSVEFYPISDSLDDMRNPDVIERILETGIPKLGASNISGIVVDTLTNILEPIISKIQASNNSSIYAYKPKSDAMKKLRHVVSKWGIETFWVYHKIEFFEKEGKDYVTKEKSYLSPIEFGRLGRDITISLEVVKDANDKRGVFVKMARRGRSGFVIWDDSGQWENIRERILESVWGGLTKEDQDAIEKQLPETFDSYSDALRWAWNYSEENGKFFNDAAHAKNSMKALKEELLEQLEDDFDDSILYEMWIKKVLSKNENLEE